MKLNTYDAIAEMRYPMKAQKDYTCDTILLLSSVFCIFLFLLMQANVSVVSAADNQFLAGKHTAKGIACNSCHKETPPKDSVSTETCFKCHGDYTKLAEQTKKVSPNPHVQHNGDLPCEACHHEHKPSVDQCSSCHNFNYKVP